MRRAVTSSRPLLYTVTHPIETSSLGSGAGGGGGSGGGSGGGGGGGRRSLNRSKRRAAGETRVQLPSGLSFSDGTSGRTTGQAAAVGSRVAVGAPSLAPSLRLSEIAPSLAPSLRVSVGLAPLREVGAVPSAPLKEEGAVPSAREGEGGRTWTPMVHVRGAQLHGAPCWAP